MSVIIIILLIFFLELSGFLITKKLGVKTRYNIIFGFLLIVAFFEVVSFPFVLLQTTFELYRRVTWILLICFYSFVFIKLKFNINTLKEWIKTFDGIKIIVYVIGAVLGIYVGIVAISITDSWLYLPMVLNPIQNNEMIYSSAHCFDGYYKLLSMLTYYSGNTLEINYIFLMSFYKFFELIIIANFLAFIAEQVFGKKERLALALLILGILWPVVYLTPSYVDFEMLLFIYRDSPNGTLFLEIMIIPMLFILLYKGYLSNKSLLLILIAGLGFSSSMIYIYPSLLVLYIGYEVFVNKKYPKKDYLIKVFMMIVPIYVFLEYLLVKKVQTTKYVLSVYSIIILFICIIIIFIMFIVLKRVKTEERMKNLFTLSLMLYLYVIIMCLLVGMLFSKSNDFIVNIFSGIFSLDSEKYKWEKYISYFSYGIWSLLYILGLILAYKKDRKLLYLHFIAVGFLANYVLYETLGQIISKNVYHRVFIFASCYIFVIMGIIFIWDKIFTKKYKIKKFVINNEVYAYVGIGLILIFNFHPIYKVYKFDESLMEYKINNQETIDLLEFDFKSPYIQTMGSVTAIQSIDQIFELNTDLIKVDTCTHDCYILGIKGFEDEKYNSDIENRVYESDTYVLTYVE